MPRSPVATLAVIVVALVVKAPTDPSVSARVLLFKAAGAVIVPAVNCIRVGADRAVNVVAAAESVTYRLAVVETTLAVGAFMSRAPVPLGSNISFSLQCH